jgi:hypothetical protein
MGEPRGEGAVAAIRSKLTYANVMVTILAFIVLGGGAYAAKTVKLKNNSVSTPKIRDAAVTGPKIAPGAIDGSKLADGSVNSAKTEDNSLTGADVNEGTLQGQPVRIDRVVNADAAVTIDDADITLVPGELRIDRVECRPPGSFGETRFILSSPTTNFTINAMWVAETDYTDPPPDSVIYLANGAKRGFTFSSSSGGEQTLDVALRNLPAPPDARAESQIIVTAPTWTVALNLHLLHQGAVCELFGTATVARD